MTDDPDFESLVRGLAGDDGRLLALLDCSVGRILRRDARRGTRPEASVAAGPASEVARWLKGELSADASWLRRVDGEGRPFKLMKLGSLEHAEAEAAKSASRSHRPAAVPLEDGDEAFLHDAGRGWRFVRLLSPAALRREGEAMGHCMGKGALDFAVGVPRFEFLSLRDPRNRPHLTMAVRDGRVVEYSGKRNEPPRDRYVRAMEEFASATGLTVSVVPGWSRRVADTSGESHFLSELPPGRTFDGCVQIEDPEVRSLPDDSVFRRCLHVFCRGIDRLPARLDVGQLRLSGSSVTEIPEDIVVRGLLQIHETDIRSIPPGLRIEGTLSIRDCPIRSLPEGLTVGGLRVTDESGLTVLPPGLTVDDRLDLRDSEVIEIGPGTSIGSLNHCGSGRGRGREPARLRRIGRDFLILRDLSLRDTDVEFLEEGLRVGGNLVLHGSKVASLSAGTVVEGCLAVGWDYVSLPAPEDCTPEGFDPKAPPLVSLPADLAVGGLILSGSRVSAIGGNLSATAFIDLRRSRIRSLPEGTRVGGWIGVCAGMPVDLPSSIADDVEIHEFEGPDLVRTTTAASYRDGNLLP